MIGQQQKDQAEKWFRNLRDKICEEFEILEAVSYTHLRAHET